MATSSPNTNDSSAANAPAPAPASPRRRRWLRRLLYSLLGLLLALIALVAFVWWWAGQDDSLARTLKRVAGWMPADQTLEANGISGSLRHGGKIDWLRWTSPALQVEIKGADIAWRLQPLLQRELKLGRVDMDELLIRSTPQPKDDSPTEPLESLLLPMRIDVPVRIAQVIWEGPPETRLTELHGHYRYTGAQHELEVSSLRYAQGFYEAKLSLQAAAPMQLEAQLKGAVQAPLPGQADKLIDVQATAQVSGTLATEAAQLKIQAQAHSEPPQASTADPLSAEIEATVRPWRSQPLEQATAQLQHVDLALFLPEGPHTDLSGSLQAGPQSPDLAAAPTAQAAAPSRPDAESSPQAWSLQADLRNSRPGPWDRQALPVREIQADVRFDGRHQWLIRTASIAVGKTGKPEIQAQGSLDTSTQAVEGQLELLGLNPADLYSTLDAAPLSGNLSANTLAAPPASQDAPVAAPAATPGEAAKSAPSAKVHFALNLQSTQGGKPQALRIDSARASGEWQAPLLQLQQVQLKALQAELNSPALEIHTDTLKVAGKADLQLPGAQLALNGHIAPDAGQGQLQLQLGSAEQLIRWLARLPGMADPLAGASLQGAAKADLQWKGGWGAIQQRFSQPSPTPKASGLQLTADLQASQLRYQAAGANRPVTQIQQLQLNLNGSPENLQARLSGQAQIDQQRLSINTRLQGGLLTSRGAAPMDWQARLESLSGEWSADGAPGSQWQASLASPLTVSQRTLGSPVRTQRIDTSAGTLQVSPPASAGKQAAGLQWEPLLLRQAANGSWAVQTKGQLQGLPLSWVDAFSPGQPLLASAGISGDLVLQGRWNIDTTGRQLVADVLIERSSGDIRLAVEDSEAATVTVVRSSGASIQDGNGRTQSAAPLRNGIRARLQELRLQLQAQGNALQAQLVWNSERAGQVNAELRSQLRYANNSFSWPEQAPLAGRIQAKLPNIGIWALFAPPGWRVGGSLQADLAISGTRSAPEWNGQLQANELSILSLLDGVDLSGGRMRASVKGTRLDINELYLQGGRGSNARILGYSGNLTAAPVDGGSLTGSGYLAFDPRAPAGTSGISMDIRVKAQGLQVLVRADRQLSASGDLQASMQNGQVVLRGDLRVDRAAILLADESAPSLGKDVYVHSAATRKADAERAAKAAEQARQSAQSAAGQVTPAKVPDILVNLDLGNDFALQGYGITTRLEGQLQLRGGSTVGAPPRVTGEIQTVQGRYRAWGQSLDVESGVVRFNGPYDNPSIDIVAIRPNIAVRAGVKVTGSANAPRVTLFSEPEMSDAEKLSWIIMGKDSTAGGAEAVLLQQAALALLSGGGGGENLAGRVGLDEIGFKGATGDGDNDGAALTLGKRLSKDLYVTYEQSLSGAMGTLFIFYDLSKLLTLRAQTGEQTAVDLIYTRKKD